MTTFCIDFYECYLSTSRILNCNLRIRGAVSSCSVSRYTVVIRDGRGKLEMREGKRGKKRGERATRRERMGSKMRKKEQDGKKGQWEKCEK